MTLTVADYQAVYVALIRNKGEFNGLAFLPYGSFFEPGEFLTNMYLPGGNRNNSLVDDADLTAKITAIESDLNATSRKQKILDLQNLLAQKMYYVPMQAGAAPAVSAYQPHMRNVIEYNVWEAGANEPNWWIEKA